MEGVLHGYKKTDILSNVYSFPEEFYLKTSILSLLLIVSVGVRLTAHLVKILCANIGCDDNGFIDNGEPAHKKSQASGDGKFSALNYFHYYDFCYYYLELVGQLEGQRLIAVLSIAIHQLTIVEYLQPIRPELNAVVIIEKYLSDSTKSVPFHGSDKNS